MMDALLFVSSCAAPGMIDEGIGNAALFAGLEGILGILFLDGI